MQRSKRDPVLLGENATHDIPSAQISALNQRARQLHRTDARGAAQLVQEALARSDAAPYPEGQLEALRLLALGALDRADYAAAADLAGRARVLAARLGARSAQAAVGVILGICETRAGDFGAALEHHHASLALYRDLGERCGEAEAMMYLGGVHIDLTHYTEAHRQLTEALSIFTEEQHQPGRARGARGGVWAQPDSPRVGCTAGRPAHRDPRTEQPGQQLRSERRQRQGARVLPART